MTQIAGTGGTHNNLRRIRMDFQARRYDTFSHTFEINYGNASTGVIETVDLTGCSAQMQVRKKKTDTLATAYMEVAISGNEITISKSNEDMDMAAGSYWYDLEVKDANGNHVTWIEGRFVVVEHVTHYIEEVEEELSTALSTVLSWLKGLIKKLNPTLYTVPVFNTVQKLLSGSLLDTRTVFLPPFAFIRTLKNIALSTKVIIETVQLVKHTVAFATKVIINTMVSKGYSTVLTTEITFTHYAS